MFTETIGPDDVPARRVCVNTLVVAEAEKRNYATLTVIALVFVMLAVFASMLLR